MDIERLRQKVFQKQKILARIYGDFGHLSLAEYVRQWKVAGFTGTDALRKEFAGILAGAAGDYFGPKTAAGLASQAGGWPLASTVDHHGIFGHPFFLNADLIYSLHPGQESLLCFSTAGVSLNNSSWPGCLLVTAPGGRLHRFSFFPDRQKTQTVLATGAFTRQSVEKVLAQVNASDFLSANRRMHLADLIREVFFDPEILSREDFSSQAALASEKLWQTVFPDAPKLLYLPLEKFISGLVCKVIARDSRHILHRLFFTVAGWDSVEKAFSGSLGAFSHAHKGSFLFWGIDSKGRRLHLARQNHLLVDHGLAVAANAEAITAGLQSGWLYPTSLACFLVLLYYEVTCLGGFNQVNWLTEIKEKFIGLLKGLGENQTAERIGRVVTDNFAEGDLALGIDQLGRIYKPTALDLYLQGNSGALEIYKNLAGHITLKESINSLLPEIYKVITPFADREAGLLAISQQDIWRADRLDQKIQSLAKV